MATASLESTRMAAATPTVSGSVRKPAATGTAQSLPASALTTRLPIKPLAPSTNTRWRTALGECMDT